MVTGASGCQLAVILIDVQKGVLTQTRRHSYLCHLLGIKNIVLAVNKMDLVNYDQTIFNSIISNYETFADTIGIKNFESIPISGLNGDNITTRSTNTKWYKGPTLLNHLEDLNIKPEKSLRHINSENLLTYFKINSIATVLLAKYFLPFFRHSEPSVFAAVSAKVGSIGDNYLGGWYGYRASKTALNMFLKNISIEYKRTCPHTIVVALHPGTTDTDLSKPFQRNVPPEKLFYVERTVNQLLNIIDNLTENDTGQFFSWDGSRLPW